MSAGARKPKPLKLKETVESEKANFDVKEFLGKGQQLKAMMPSSYPNSSSADNSDQTAVIDPFAPKAMQPSQSTSSQNLHLVETQNGTQEFSKTLPLPGSGVLDRPSSMFNSPGQSYDSTSTNVLSNESSMPKKKSSVKWIDPNAIATPAPQPKTQPKKSETSVAPFAMLIGAVGLISYVLFAPGGPAVTAGGKKLSAAELKERIEYHTKTTGWRLNNERIETQIENHYQAPGLPAGAQKVKPADMMNGLPLQGESNSLEGLRDKTMPVNPTYADAKIMYGLQEEQDRVETEKRAQKLYLQEFVENAAADGYAVKVDKNGNVLQVKKMKPESQTYEE